MWGSIEISESSSVHDGMHKYLKKENEWANSEIFAVKCDKITGQVKKDLNFSLT